MQDFPYEYNATVRIDDDGDARALGGAVTVALCGHWEHNGPCRWPHHTATVDLGSGRRAVTTRFACSDVEEPAVRAQIAAALATGSLERPDRPATTWRIVG
jgi:hypothetical protein